MRNNNINLDKNFASLGSFWTYMLEGTARKEAFALSTLSTFTRIKESSINCLCSLMNNNINSQVFTNKELDISPTDFSKVRISNNKYVIDANGEYLLIKLDTNSYFIKYITLIDEGVFKYFINGIDFVNCDEGLLFLKKDIITIKNYNFIINGTYKFNSEENKYILRAYTGIDNSYLGYNTSIINSYIGGSNQSLVDFNLFLNAFLGCKIISKSGVLKNIITINNIKYGDIYCTKIYVFDTFVEQVKQNTVLELFNTLTIDQYYPKNTIIDQKIKIFMPNSYEDISYFYSKDTVIIDGSLTITDYAWKKSGYSESDLIIDINNEQLDASNTDLQTKILNTNKSGTKFIIIKLLTDKYLDVADYYASNLKINNIPIQSLINLIYQQAPLGYILKIRYGKTDNLNADSNRFFDIELNPNIYK